MKDNIGYILAFIVYTLIAFGLVRSTYVSVKAKQFLHLFLILAFASTFTICLVVVILHRYEKFPPRYVDICMGFLPVALVAIFIIGDSAEKKYKRNLNKKVEATGDSDDASP